MWGLTAAGVFDGERFVDRPTVLVDGGRVVAVGVALPGSIEVVDLGAATIMPGFVDCHQHLCFDGVGTLEEQVARVDDGELAGRARGAARRAALGGVTTLRDLGDRSFVTLGLRGDPGLPTILAAGPPITPVEGHCWFLGGETTGAPALLAAVRDRAERGCDVVKVMVTGGAMTPTFPLWKSQFSDDEVRLVVDEAHRLGLPVAAHCHGVDGIRTAVAVGVDTIEHCTFFTDAMVSSPPTDLLDDLAASGIALSATIGALPDRVLPPTWAEAAVVVAGAQGHVHRGGGVVVVGTDAGINVFKPHDVMPWAFGPLRAIGMSIVEAMRAMTSAGADAIGAAGKGRLAAGADADMLALDGDPRTDDTAIRRVERVWIGGESIR
jgi:imidazolonepropionase-like amidohydrolase